MGYTEGSDMYLDPDISQTKDSKKVNNKKDSYNNYQHRSRGVLYKPLDQPNNQDTNGKDK